MKIRSTMTNAKTEKDRIALLHGMLDLLILGTAGSRIESIQATGGGHVARRSCSIGRCNGSKRGSGSLVNWVFPTKIGGLASVVCLFLFVAAIASYVPARRAMRIAPLAALRSE